MLILTRLFLIRHCIGGKTCTYSASQLPQPEPGLIASRQGIPHVLSYHIISYHDL